jgi:hypothetical protein
MFSLSGVRKYVASWEQFCEAVKREAEHGADADPRDEDHDMISVDTMLDALHEIVQESGLIRTLPADRILYRVRAHQKAEVCTTRETLGPPPPEKAPTNRMSAAGVSVFYGAFEMATALAEAGFSMPADSDWTLTGAAWQCARPLQVLDLSELPPVPSIFAASRDWRGALLFLGEFAESISAPVVHDRRAHIEYVPTQILTDYFRRQALAIDGSALDGIVYPSARRRGGRSLVVFRSREDLDPASLCGQEPLLTLVADSVKRLRRPARKAR